MPPIPDNVRQALITFVPASLINEISCFVFHDHHPRDKTKIDVTICTFRGEVKEFYQREIVSSVVVKGYVAPGNVQILRSSKNELFYLLTFGDEIVILSRKNKLEIHNRIKNVDRHEIEDSTCEGKAYLKIVLKDDAVPLVLDDNFHALKDQSVICHNENKDQSSPLLTQLARKLTETKYSVKCNKKALTDLVNLRQLAAYAGCKETSSNTGAVFQDNKGTSSVLSLKTWKPWVGISNKKIVIALDITNEGYENVQYPHFLLKSETQQSLVYETKIFESIKCCPYWKEKKLLDIEKGQSITMVLVIDLKEALNNVYSRIDLNGAIAYKYKSKDYLIPFEEISLSCLDIMGQNFDVLYNIQNNETNYSILSLLATSEKTDLCVRYVKTEDDLDINLLVLFCKHLNMEMVRNSSNMVVHLKSPYNILHGLLVIQGLEENDRNKWTISIHSRSQSQILAFLHYMHDAIPFRIITTTAFQKIEAKQSQLSEYSEDTSSPFTKLNYSILAQSLMNQTSLTLQYLDDCLIKMNESKDPKVVNKIGTEIDVFAGGQAEFEEFKRKMLQEEGKGLRCLHQFTQTQCEQEELEGMVVDIDD